MLNFYSLPISINYVKCSTKTNILFHFARIWKRPGLHTWRTTLYRHHTQINTKTQTHRYETKTKHSFGSCDCSHNESKSCNVRTRVDLRDYETGFQVFQTRCSFGKENLRDTDDTWLFETKWVGQENTGIRGLIIFVCIIIKYKILYFTTVHHHHHPQE